MPYKDPEANRRYQLAYIHRRRQEWITENGPCQRCGSTEDLQVDRIDPSTKLFNPKAVWNRRKEVREAELAKCQVLCKDCHREKTLQALADRETCTNGHVYAEVGVYLQPLGWRKCAECARINNRKSHARRKKAA